MVQISKNNYPSNDHFLRIFEKYWGLNLPKSYREFLLDKNGGEAEANFFYFKNSKERSSVRYFFGFTDRDDMNILNRLKIYLNRFPDNTFPIASDCFGNLILLSVKGSDRGKVYFWDHDFEAEDGVEPDYSNLTLIADSFDEFIHSLKSDDEVKI